MAASLRPVSLMTVSLRPVSQSQWDCHCVVFNKSPDLWKTKTVCVTAETTKIFGRVSAGPSERRHTTASQPSQAHTWTRPQTRNTSVTRVLLTSLSVFVFDSGVGGGVRKQASAYLSRSSLSCMLNSMDGISLSICWGSQMMACSSSFTVFLTTPCRPLIPATRILTKTHDKQVKNVPLWYQQSFLNTQWRDDMTENTFRNFSANVKGEELMSYTAARHHPVVHLYFTVKNIKRCSTHLMTGDYVNTAVMSLCHM